jgi:hypothetical protein
VTRLVVPRGWHVVHDHEQGQLCVTVAAGGVGCYLQPGWLARLFGAR